MIRMDALEQARNWLAAMRPLPADVLAELRHRYEVSLTHHSTAIEGNTLTQSETQIVIEKGITIAGKSLREHLEVIGHKDALDFVFELANGSGPVREREIREIHSLVMKGQGPAGAFRTLDVRAAGTDFVYPSHLKVPELMAEFVDWLAGGDDGVEFAAEAHLRFVTIHPFQDGNGRVGRLLMNLLLVRSGYPVAVIPVEQRAAYIHSLESAQSGGDSGPLYSLVGECVERALRDTLGTCQSSAELVKRLGSEAEAARRWLRGLPSGQ